MTFTLKNTLAVGGVVLLLLTATSCGGASGGPGPSGAGQGLVLLTFQQAGNDNLPISQVLELVFSEPVDEATVGPATIQIRKGPFFGETADGTFEIVGSLVRFLPRLPSQCGYADSGFTPDTTYSVTVVGSPESLPLRNTQGQPLAHTETFEFSTLPDSDPAFLVDQIPGTLPMVFGSTPVAGTPGVPVFSGNECMVRFTENVDPCSLVANQTVSLRAYQVGQKTLYQEVTPGGPETGFNPVADSETGNPYDWGGNASGLPLGPTRVPVSLELLQTDSDTILYVRPTTGRFPENCLMVLDLTFGVQDFGGSPLQPASIDFTTENLHPTPVDFMIEFDGTTPVETAETTADVNTARSPSLAQGWISYGGDGDNGPLPLDIPAFPTIDPSLFTFTSCATRTNDGDKDHFDPDVDAMLHTGIAHHDPLCTNSSDGSSAVVFEFASFRIRSGVTVTIEGENPAVILVNGPVTIEPGGLLQVSGKNGGNGISGCQPGGAPGEAGPGGGDGGRGGYQSGSPTAYGGDGESGFGAPDPFTAPGTGGGEGGVNAYDPPGWAGSGVGGGGGGHSVAGTNGQAQLSGNGQFAWAASPVKGGGGGAYQSDGTDLMFLPSAGSGGGGGGCDVWGTWQTGSCDSTTGTGGGGGGGGGLVAITSSGDINISGEIRARGGRGGNGGEYYYAGAAGGGGGAGGGIRLLTPGNIVLSAGTLDCSGGVGGLGNPGTYSKNGGTINPPHFGNNGGAGAVGRIVLEDGDGVIAGIGSAALVPTSPEPGFYTAPLDASRFVSGGTEGVATTEPILLGSIIDPTALVVEQLASADFLAGIPSGADVGPGNASMVVEIQGYLADADAEIDMGSASGWWTVGYHTWSGSGMATTWLPDAAPGGWVPDAGIGIANLNSSTVYVQVRVTFYLPSTLETSDPGPYLDWMKIRFTADN